MKSEGQDPLHVTLLAATLGQLMLSVAKDFFPHQRYFDLHSGERQTVADHVRNLLREAQATFWEPDLFGPKGNISFPPQRGEDYL
ncbi:MAG: hypothetical protein ACE5I9_04915 [Candidatus Methylomirabilales bacterium]